MLTNITEGISPMSAVTVDLKSGVGVIGAAVEKLPQRPIVFFDGVCGFCNYWVDFILARDPEGKMVFAPLQGVTAGQLLPTALRENLNSLVFWTPQRAYDQTSAIVRILWLLGGFWGVLGTVLWLIPRPLRNWGYRLIARNRYRIAGKKEACRMPTPAERSRLLP